MWQWIALNLEEPGFCSIAPKHYLDDPRKVERAFDRLGADCTTRTLFSRAAHFGGQHEDEVLYRAGPFTVTHLEEELKEHA